MFFLTGKSKPHNNSNARAQRINSVQHRSKKPVGTLAHWVYLHLHLFACSPLEGSKDQFSVDSARMGFFTIYKIFFFVKLVLGKLIVEVVLFVCVGLACGAGLQSCSRVHAGERSREEPH